MSLIVTCRTCGGKVEGLLDYENHAREHEARGEVPARVRCASYQRGSGMFIYSRARCELTLGHAEQHWRSGRFLDPRQGHYWGRITQGGTRV